MKAISFDVNDADVRRGFLQSIFPDAIAELEESSQPHWGKMSAQEMVEHLIWAIELSTGQKNVECPTPEGIRQKTKTFLYDNRPTPREFMNPLLAGGLPALRHASLADAMAALRVQVGYFNDYLLSLPDAVNTHPILGPINTQEWDRVHFKHFCHHLLQFGLIELRMPSEASSQSPNRIR